MQLVLIRRVLMLLFIIGSAVVKTWTSIFIQAHSNSNLSMLMPVSGGKTVETTRSGIAGAVRAFSSSTDISVRTASNLRGKQKKSSSAQFGLAVAHCNEDYLASWIDEIDGITLPDENGRPTSTSWDATIYERCGQKVSPKYSEFQRNMGSEECTAYLRYIVDRYDDLPEIVYFLQPDSLRFNPKGHQHTKFSSLQELVAASAPLMTPKSRASGTSSSESPIGFLNLGNETIDATRLISREGPNNNPVEIIDMMKDRAPQYEEDTMLEVLPGACFAVRRERILSQPAEFYKDLILEVIAHEEETWTCFSLEATWHVIFGERLAMPKEASLMYHLEEKNLSL